MSWPCEELTTTWSITDASTRSEHSWQTTGAYVYHCAFTLARARALAEITRANICVHSLCQRSACTFTQVAEQEVGYLSIISINFLLTRSKYSLRVLPTNVRSVYSQQCELCLRHNTGMWRQMDTTRCGSIGLFLQQFLSRCGMSSDLRWSAISVFSSLGPQTFWSFKWGPKCPRTEMTEDQSGHNSSMQNTILQPLRYLMPH